MFLSVTNHISLALISPWFFPGRSLLQPPTSLIILSCISGLKRIHALTTQAAYELHVDLEDFDNGTAYAHYGSFGVGLFSVDPEEDGYPLTVADYSGTAGRGPGCGWGWGRIGAAQPPPQLEGRKEVFPGQGPASRLLITTTKSPASPHPSHIKLAGPLPQNHPFCR